MQLYCGVSVVDSKQWEALKKYNINELYMLKDPAKGEPAKDASAKKENVESKPTENA